MYRGRIMTDEWKIFIITKRSIFCDGGGKDVYIPIQTSFNNLFSF